MVTIGIFVFDGAEELDWAGPWEVLRAWAAGWPEDGAHVFTFSPAGGPVVCAKGLRVVADHAWDHAPQMDVLVYPGGRGTRHHVGDETIVGRLRAAEGAGTVLASVCTGALVLAAAGLLDGLPATTHWASLDRLATLGDGIEVRPDDRYVDNGRILTAAGVSAGIDLALHLVARLASPARAAEVRRYIQYDPSPPV